MREVVKRFVIWASLFSLAAFLILPEGSPSVHHLAFYAHNAAGGFISIILALCVGLYFDKGEKKYLLFSILNLFLLYQTGSRGSLLAFVIAIIQVIVFKERFTKLIIICVVTLNILLLSISYPFYLDAGKPFDESIRIINFVSSISRRHTIIDRLFNLWPRAIDFFLKSPIVGQGFGSYNDTLDHYKNYGFAILFKPKMIVNNDAHAHHSFLNILAETGITGLFLFILYLVYLRRFIGLYGTTKGIELGLRIAFWVVIWSSFTEHRITTPSQMLPFNILIGLALSNYRSYQAQMNIAYNNNVISFHHMPNKING